MTLIEEIIALDSEIKQSNLPFDEGLPMLQNRLGEIADKHNTNSPDVFKIYMDWKSGKINQEK